MFEFFATAAKNLPPLLGAELIALGVQQITESPAGVRFEGSLELGYRACLWSRVASRVLMVLARFPASSPEELYQGVLAFPWKDHLNPSTSFAVDFHSQGSQITHSHFGALKVKDALVDYFRLQCGTRPSVNKAAPQILINVYVYRDQATVSLDLSGQALHRRGYREESVLAPLKENLAAALLLRAGWRTGTESARTLVDPLCGSGTFPIEAALIAYGIAPGLLRSTWGFTHWLAHDSLLWEKIHEEASAQKQEALRVGAQFQFFGFDQDPVAVHAATHNAMVAGLGEHIQFEVRSLPTLTRPAASSKPGFIIVNPPYGERLGEIPELELLYAQLGRTLLTEFLGWNAAIFSGNPELIKRIGLRYTRAHHLFNGPIECQLYHYLVEPPEARIAKSITKILSEVLDPETVSLVNRFKKNARHLRHWREREGIHCYRLYDADIPEYAFAIDVYTGEQTWIQMQEYAPPATVDPHKAKTRQQQTRLALAQMFNIPLQNVFLKQRLRQKGHTQYEKQAHTQKFSHVVEDDCHFWVNFSDYLDTGLFLDHRLTRLKIKQLAKDRDFLNLFGYTGTASVYAARGGARSTHTLDLSNTYLDWAQRNMELNSLDGPKHHYLQVDCLRWLMEDHPERYGLIFLDPPTFSTSKRMDTTFDIQRDHAALLAATLHLLTPNGILIFSTNKRRFKLDSTPLDAYTVENITEKTLPMDFARNPHIHQCWMITPLASAPLV